MFLMGGWGDVEVIKGDEGRNTGRSTYKEEGRHVQRNPCNQTQTCLSQVRWCSLKDYNPITKGGR